MLYNETPEKERLIVRKIRTFIEDEAGYSVALIAGMRHVGKSTVLDQLRKYYPDAVKIDFSVVKDDPEERLEQFFKKPSSLLLLDEITHLDGYDLICEEIFKKSSGQSGWNFKVVITGSSTAHLCKIALNKLGGGRCRLFFLPVITFVEYLYFIDKIPSYQDYSEAKPEHFRDYLQLKDLTPGLTLTFTEEYFQDYYSINNLSNDNSHVGRSNTPLQEYDVSYIAVSI